jgi:predicted ATPase
MPELPSGTVTFLFTDIEGSTRLLRELGPERYADALAEHRRVLRDAFAAGAEVDTQGDAFFYAFADATEAAAAARAGQETLASGAVSVRMGLHTGEPLLRGDHYVGDDVHLGARVAACGHGGQVVLTKATRDLLDGAALRDLGEHRIKDFEAPVWIYQLGEELFPPLKTISNTNLPHPASSFVGREREVAEVAAVLGEARLVTLTGPGGSGKTRLSIETAAELVGEFKNGVFWVGLATVHDPSGVVPAVAQTIGAAGDLAGHLGEREMLLLLDNLEQVVAAAPELAGIVEACPNVRMLVTSRELLRVRGEVEYEVLALAAPDAVELFCLRSGLSPSPSVEELCRRLDNMPLALELAAARTKALTPEQILERLSERLDLFKGGRDAEVRQATLRATIEWSHDLLTPEEQELFASLGVFAGGCTLEAAEAIAGADVDTLQSLVEKSLVRHTEGRFWMLETIREYAVERLGDAPELRDRFARWYLALAESANLTHERMESGRQRQDLVLPEQANLREAIDWALADGRVELAADLVLALEIFWVTHDPFEGMRRTQAVLDSEGLPPSRRTRLKIAFASSADPVGFSDAAEEAYREGLAAARAEGDEAGIAHLSMRLGSSALKRGELGTARQLLEDSISRCREIGSAVTLGVAIGILGGVDWAEGDHELALERYEESASIAHEANFTWWESNMSGDLADANLQLGRIEESDKWARKMLSLAAGQNDRQGCVWALALVAAVARASGKPERAGHVWGAIEAEEARGPVGTWESERPEFEALVVTENDPSFEAARAAGRLLSLERAVEDALSDA